MNSAYTFNLYIKNNYSQMTTYSSYFQWPLYTGWTVFNMFNHMVSFTTSLNQVAIK